MKDYYRILKISPDSSIDEIIRAYHKLAGRYDPDKVDIHYLEEEEIQWLRKKFKDIVKAKAILSNPRKRKNYDDYLERRLHSRPESQDFSNCRSATGREEPKRHRERRSSSSRDTNYRESDRSKSRSDGRKKSGRSGRGNDDRRHSADNRQSNHSNEDNLDIDPGSDKKQISRKWLKVGSLATVIILFFGIWIIRDKGLKENDFVLGIVIESKAQAYLIRAIKKIGRLESQVGAYPIVLEYRKEQNIVKVFAINIRSGNLVPVKPFRGSWSTWLALYPNTDVYK